MTLLEAIQARHSVRKYKDEPIHEDVLTTLQDRIREINQELGLHIQLVTGEPKAFSGPMAYGSFSGVKNYLVMAGKKGEDLDEKIGYWGEQLVLLAQTLGLNTCWAWLSYRKVAGTYELEDGEKIGCYIALGVGQTQGSGHKVKDVRDISNASDLTRLQGLQQGPEGAGQAGLLDDRLLQDGPRNRQVPLRARRREEEFRMGLESPYLLTRECPASARAV